MSSLTPVVLESADIVAFVQYVLDHHSTPTTLIVCCSKAAFLKQLRTATLEKSNRPRNEENEGSEPELEASADNGRAHSRQTQANPWSVPTLRLLASSRTIKLAFCPEVTNLRAYLATYAQRLLLKQKESNIPSISATDAVPILAVLSPIQLHRPTSAFSAQGLNRTFAIAVEAAHNTNSRLALAECPIELDAVDPDDQLANDDEGTQEVTKPDAWDEEVSILNVTTKTFGAGERGWVGRTVKIRAIAERWCEFQKLPDPER